MEALALVIGLGILIVALIDLAWTTLWVAGHAGPLTGRLSALAWRLTLRAAAGRHRLLSLFGPASLVGAIVVWSGLLWLAWALIFSADPSSVRDADSGVPGDLVDRFYFTGYALFTMGNGDLAPGPAWRIPTVLMNATGIVLLTLVVSYLLSIVSAVVSSRTLASRITALGSSADDIVVAGWDGGTLRSLEGPLSSFEAGLSRLAEQHAAYPILRYYHSADRSKALVPAVAELDDALTVLDGVQPPDLAPSRIVRESLRNAIDAYRTAYDIAADGSEGRDPEPPRVSRAIEVGIPLSLDRIASDTSGLSVRRVAMAEMLERDGWRRRTP